MFRRWLALRRAAPTKRAPEPPPAVATAAAPAVALPAARAPCGDEVFAQVREARRTIYPSGAALDLLRYMQRELYVGWIDISELEARWRERHGQLGLSSLRWDQVREAFGQLPDVRKRRCRVIGTPDYAELAARMKKRGRLREKHTIFWVPDHIETGDEAVPSAVMPEGTPVVRFVAGQRPPAPSADPAADRDVRPDAGATAAAGKGGASHAARTAQKLAERCADTMDMFAPPRRRAVA